MSGKNTGEIRFEFDPDNPPRMPEERMAKLRAMTDEDIDFSDIPPQTGPPTRRVHGPRFSRPQDVVALEPDVIRFFEETGGASSARINAALREYAEKHRKSA
jgi:uncharacterized protein (DUF4415 family)